MNRRHIVRHAIGAFVLASCTIFMSSAIGFVVFDLLEPSAHYLKASQHPLRVMADGAMVVLLVSFPAPFALATISTIAEIRREA